MPSVEGMFLVDSVEQVGGRGELEPSGEDHDRLQARGALATLKQAYLGSMQMAHVRERLLGEPNPCAMTAQGGGELLADKFHGLHCRGPQTESLQTIVSGGSKPHAGTPAREPVTIVTGMPIPDSLLGRSSLNQRASRGLGVEMMISSKPYRLIASSIAATGSGSPTMPSTRIPTASRSAGRVWSSSPRASLAV